ncbi:Acyl-ACP--UDP-N-acetylglucosamine O-acyltransferase [Candidatus Bealeia paramacronuclearis]|uniref:Acyl-[acyl-carrier-protein]--UDP-N-acetylglucosamine O-acyltransferase n=1 Tax=Candidatus Bealeia paramacronuclearis TaxID=1921001 RepID=A0ABZ2C628_9PROT|nr:Acyl-ACP--UDP-N-acetylglucosamine O-acyltransferase [Candidatus Bealeia paramacronuclearis]
MTAQIHPTALVDPSAQLGEGVIIGPYSIVGPHVQLGKNVVLRSHVVIEGHVSIGENTQIFPFAVLGQPPQNINYKGEPSRIEIGSNNVIREHVTIHPGTEHGGMVTKIGNNCYFMVSTHVAHDCELGNNIIMANNATIGGHVKVGDFVVIGGLAAIHQFVRIGEHAFIAGTAGVNEDVIPFGAVMTIKSRLGGLNLMGIKRRGFSRNEMHNLRNAYNLLVSDKTINLKDRLKKIEDTYSDCPAVKRLIDFINAEPDRPLCLPSETWDFHETEELENNAASARR